MAINATIYFLASSFRVSIGLYLQRCCAGFACVILYITGFVMLFPHSELWHYLQIQTDVSISINIFTKMTKSRDYLLFGRDA